MSRPRIRLLGGFEVEADGRTVDEGAFERRQAASLVKLLALAGGHRLHREQVIDALWPEATIDQAAPRLHKAASYARSAIGDKGAVILRGESVLLWPDDQPDIDVEQFEIAADLAASGSVDEAAAAADLYSGDLLPGDPYEEWSIAVRERLRLRYLDVLRVAGRWEEVLEVEPADEAAHIQLMRRLVAEGRRTSTLRQFERLERALSEELGVGPSDEARALRRQVLEDQPDRVTLIDRTEERRALQEALDGAQQGTGSFVLLTGVPGIGKTALAEWLADRAGQIGWLSCQGVAASVNGPWPYAPILDAIEDLLRQAPELLDDLPDTHRSELQRVREAPGSAHEGFGGDDGHQRLFVAVDRLFREAARSRGLVLFIDDLHAADDASVGLVHYLGRQAARERLLVVGTSRPGVASEALEGVRSLAGRRGGTELRVGPLGTAHVAELARATAVDPLTDAMVEHILTASGGTPFYVEELAKSAGAGGASLPDHMATIVAASLADLSGPLRDALARVAVAGNRFDTDQFIALSGVDEDEAFDLLDRALAHEILEHSTGGYQFRHGLLRDSLLEGLAPHRHRTVHRDAAHRFETMGAPPARIAHHLIEAEEFAEAAPWAHKAAKAAQAVGALSDARSLIDPVIDHASQQVRIDLLMLRADVLAGMGDPGAVAAFQHALQVTEGPIQRLIRAKMARAAMMSGDIESAGAILDGLEPDGGPFDGPVLHARGMLAYMTGDLDSAEVAAAEARKFALAPDAPGSLLDVLTLQGMVAHNKGEWFERMRNELTSTADSAELAATVFDCHL